jgi:hypothetical protein
MYFPYAIFAYHAWTYVLLLSIRAHQKKLGTLIALGLWSITPYPLGRRRQPFGPRNCQRKSEEPCQGCV